MNRYTASGRRTIAAHVGVEACRKSALSVRDGLRRNSAAALLTPQSRLHCTGMLVKDSEKPGRLLLRVARGLFLLPVKLTVQ